MLKISPIERVANVCAELELVAPTNFIFIDTYLQSLTLYNETVEAMVCSASTSKFGIGNREGSYMTPLGLHIIEEKIGDGAKPWTIFKSRENTEVVWRRGMADENQILTRILRLRGLEEGVNVGTGIDSYDRFIYIHGTNNEKTVGKPMSHGCVCLKNDDVIKLFDLVSIGTIVYIG